MKANDKLDKSKYGGDKPETKDLIEYLYDKEIGNLQTKSEKTPEQSGDGGKKQSH